MKITVACYRKAYPQEILFQLEPVLRKAGLRWWEIIGLLQEELRRRGFEVFDVTEDEEGDSHYICVTDGKEHLEDSHPHLAQLMRPSEIIRRDDGSYQQGFRLHSRGWPAEQTVETLFVPDYNGIHVGDLVECRYDTREAVWRPGGKTKRVAAPWNAASLEGDSQSPLGHLDDPNKLERNCL